MRLLLLCALVATAAADPRHARPFPPPAAALAPSLATTDAASIWGIDRSPVRNEQIQILEQLIMNTADSEVEEKADYLFRLATIFTKIAVNERGTDKGKDYLLKALKTYKALTDDDRYRNYAKLDAALFQYGYVLQSGKYMKEARAVYHELLKDFPQSSHVPGAHVAFADYYFEAGQLADAEAFYKMVLKFPRSAVYPYALYKLGWVHFRLQRPQEALEAMHQVATLTRTDAKQAKLAEAARKDFVGFYAVIGKPASAHAVFERVDPKHADEMLAQLNAIAPDAANAAWTAGRFAEAGRTYASVASDVATPNDKAREAARNAVAAYMNALNIDPDPVVQLGKLELRPRTARVTRLSATELEMLELFALYAALVRDARDEHAGTMRLVEAGMFRAHGDHAHAVPVLIDYLHWNAQPVLAELAARALLDSLVAQGKQADALAIVARWEQQDFLAGKAELARDVDLIRSRSPRR